MPNVEDLKRQLAEAEEAERRERHLTTQGNVETFRQQENSENRYAATTWGQSEFDFTTPSGQLCRLKNLELEKLAEAGILEQVSRLPGVANALVEKSSGQPPKQQDPNAMPDRDTIAALVQLCNVIVPMVVVAPQIEPLPEDGEERLKSLIYVDSIGIEDRVAILNRVLGGLQRFDSFREQS